MPCRRWLVVVAFFVRLMQQTPAAAPDAGLAALLRDADRFAWLTNWGAAGTIYASAEKAALANGDRRSATYARFGRLRAEMQTRQLGALSEELALQLAQPLVANDSRLRLRGLTVKGDVDLEWDLLAALRDWQQVRELARQLGDTAWENRANGELGMIAFLRGNTGEATKAVQQALDTARKLGDVGGELRYLSAIGNGLLLAGYVPVAAGFVDRALALARDNPETGFPFVATSTKVLILIELKQYDEAERFAQSALAEARVGDRRIKEIELRLMLARVPERAALVLLGDAGAGEDGLLQPREIARYNLNARLVVLSACDTAVGPTLGQEGVVNLARAFLVAGAGAVMTSLWPVDDTLSAALMRAFYGRLAGGETLTAALRGAKAELGQRFGAKASGTIGAFQLIGDGSKGLSIGASPSRVAASGA